MISPQSKSRKFETPILKPVKTGFFIGSVAKIGVLFFLFLFLSGYSVCYAEQLKASWYSRASLIKEGTWKNGERMMANGEQFNDNLLCCATRLYKLGSILRVTHRNAAGVNRVVVVKVTDRIGKRFAKTRIDLTPVAFQRLDKLEKGIIPITAEVIK